MKFREMKEAAGGNLFLKVDNGQSVRGVFRGDPYYFESHWIESKRRSEVCTGAGCQLCESGIDAGDRFRLNFIVKENGVYVAKIFEGSPTTNNRLAKLSKKYDLSKSLMEISKDGKFTSIDYDGGLDPDQERKIAAVPLQDLVPKSTKPQEPERGFVETDDDLPF